MAFWCCTTKEEEEEERDDINDAEVLFKSFKKTKVDELEISF